MVTGCTGGNRPINWNSTYHPFKRIFKMERKDVYKLIDGERNYQDAKWGTRRTADEIPDEEKLVAEWINYIEFHLSKAKERVYHLDTEGALAEIRKVSALGVIPLHLNK